jgi:hypothetical protein
MSLSGRLALKGRSQIGAARCKAPFIVSIVMLPVLAGCSASTDLASIPHKTITDMFGSSRGATEAAAMQPPPNVSAGIASQPGATVPPAPATHSADASAPPPPLAPATNGANIPVTQGVPAASVPPDASPDQPAPPPAKKGPTEVCWSPTEPCDNNHRITN